MQSEICFRYDELASCYVQSEICFIVVQCMQPEICFIVVQCNEDLEVGCKKTSKKSSARKTRGLPSNCQLLDLPKSHASGRSGMPFLFTKALLIHELMASSETRWLKLSFFSNPGAHGVYEDLPIVARSLVQVGAPVIRSLWFV